MDLESVVARITQEVYARINKEADGAAAAPKKGGLAEYVEYSLLNPSMKINDVRNMCETAKNKGFAGICIPQWFVSYAKDLLKETGVKICTPVSLPGGRTATAAKYAEVKEAVKSGADEVDIPLNIGFIKNGNLESAKNDFEEAMMPARGTAAVKAVIEMGMLSDEQVVEAVTVARECGADYIVMSGVLNPKSNSPEDLKRVIKACGGQICIKVCGGVKNASDIRNMVDSGADRVGTSAIADI